MKVKKISALFGLFAGALVLFSFSMPPGSVYGCTLKVKNNSTTYMMGMDSYDGSFYIATNDEITVSNNCLCPESTGSHIPYVQAYGPSSQNITYTVTGGDDGTVSGTINGGSWEYYDYLNQ